MIIRRILLDIPTGITEIQGIKQIYHSDPQVATNVILKLIVVDKRCFVQKFQTLNIFNAEEGNASSK